MSVLTDFLDSITGKKEISELRSETDGLQGAIQYLVEDAMYSNGVPLEPSELVGRLSEWDSQLIDELVSNRQWDVMGGLGSAEFYDTEMMRERAIANSKHLSFSPLGEWIIRVWTNYGMGDTIDVVANDDEADKVWQEFWRAERNADLLADDNLQYLSDFTLQEGNTFLVFFVSKDDGLVTIDEINSNEIKEIITNPNRKSEKLFYKRVFEGGNGMEVVYYPDWKAKFNNRLELVELPDDAIRADTFETDDEILRDIEDNLGTDVVVLHIAHNRKSRESHFGWPILTSASPYIKAHKRFLEDRLTVAASKAMFTRNKRITGGSRAIDSVKTQLMSRLSSTNYYDGNPPPAAGSVELDNQAITTTEKPMTTGASDARVDWEMFSHQALIGGGLFPTTAGMDTTRWATALSMDKTLAMQWSKYQTFWSSQFRRMVMIVLKFAEMYGGKNFKNEEGVGYGANVSIDTLSLVDFPDVVKSLSQAVSDMLLPFVQTGTIPVNTSKAILRELWLIMLQSLGLSASRDLASEKAFEVGDFAVEEPEESPMTPSTNGSSPPVPDDDIEFLDPELRDYLLKSREYIKKGDMDGFDALLEMMGE